MFSVTGVPENTVCGGTWLTIGISTETVTLVDPKADPAPLVAVAVKLSVVFAATTGVVKVAVAVFALVSTTCGTSVGACVQAKVIGVDPLAEALSVTSAPLPEITALGVALATTLLGGVIRLTQLEVFGAMLLGQGLRIPAKVLVPPGIPDEL
jgi:hypothetical protein